MSNRFDRVRSTNRISSLFRHKSSINSKPLQNRPLEHLSSIPEDAPHAPRAPQAPQAPQFTRRLAVAFAPTGVLQAESECEPKHERKMYSSTLTPTPSPHLATHSSSSLGGNVPTQTPAVPLRQASTNFQLLELSIRPRSPARSPTRPLRSPVAIPAGAKLFKVPVLTSRPPLAMRGAPDHTLSSAARAFKRSLSQDPQELGTKRRRF